MDDTMLSIARAALSCGRRQDGHDVSLVSCRINIDLRLPPPFSPSPILLRWRCQVACVNNQGLRLRQTQAVPSPTSLLRSSTSSCSPRPLLCNLKTASPRLNRRPVCRSSTDVPTLAYRQLCLVHLPCCSLLRCEMRQDGHDLSLVSCLYLPLRHPCVLPVCSHI